MFRLFAPVLLLEAFCLYHAYKNKKDRMWYWIILLLPLIGSIIYLFDNVFNQINSNAINDELKSLVNSNRKVQHLEKALQFADTIVNKTALADEYVRLARYTEAIALYGSCLEGYNADDPDILVKLLKTNYLNHNYKEAIANGLKLEGRKEFENSEERIAYALAMHHQNDTVSAKQVFESMDVPYTNYQHRLEYCRLLLETGQKHEAKDKLQEILSEFDHMDRLERRHKKDVYGELTKLCLSLND